MINSLGGDFGGAIDTHVCVIIACGLVGLWAWWLWAWASRRGAFSAGLGGLEGSMATVMCLGFGVATGGLGLLLYVIGGAAVGGYVGGVTGEAAGEK